MFWFVATVLIVLLLPACVAWIWFHNRLFPGRLPASSELRAALRRLRTEEICLEADARYGLVLAGGGGKGAYQIGALRALRRFGISRFDPIAGTSVGALNGVLVAQSDLPAAARIWRQLRVREVMAPTLTLPFALIARVLLLPFLLLRYPTTKARGSQRNALRTPPQSWRSRILMFLWLPIRRLGDIIRLVHELDIPSRLLRRGAFGDLSEVLEEGSVDAKNGQRTEDAEAVNQLLAQVRQVVAREHFLHWQIAFPTVWRELERRVEIGGFDAVIGNPPWDRLKLQEVEWFAAREPEIALSARAADRKRKIEQLARRDTPLWQEYLEARDAAETAVRVARESGEYPQLARGDLNIYSLFVERAQRLVQAKGVIGLLVPSGIASDKSASAFFKEVSTSGRLRALYDFENKKVFFPDVDSRFKFSALVFGGVERHFNEAACAFFLHSVDELKEADRRFALGPKDFDAVNPNTGTAPIFRSRRDAEITTGIYQRVPILVDHRGGESRSAWPVRYVTMFHMTNDSGLFKSRPELEAEGWYPAEGKRWKRGKAEAVPLYEGKMVQMYDHRAASIEVHPENIHRPAQPLPATDEQHRDPTWLPDPQYWVERSEVAPQFRHGWTIGFKDITAPTNVRTMIATAAPAVAFGKQSPTAPARRGDRAEDVHAPGSAPSRHSQLVRFRFRRPAESAWADDQPLHPGAASTARAGCLRRDLRRSVGR